MKTIDLLHKFRVCLIAAISALSLSVIVTACKSNNHEAGAKLADVPYVADDLSGRFTLVETCSGNWRDGVDRVCVIGKGEHEVPSTVVYRAVGLDISSGSAGQREIASRQAIVDRISGADVRQKAQAALDEFKRKVSRKNIIKQHLANGQNGAACFDGAFVGESGVSCRQLEAAVGGPGGSTSNTSTSGSQARYTINEIMEEHKKDRLRDRVLNGRAYTQEKQKLLELYEALAANTPPKGDPESWRRFTSAIVVAARHVVEGKSNSVDELRKATACGDCHNAHMP